MFFNRENRKFFIDDIEKISEYVKINCRDEVEEIINIANDVVNKKYSNLIGIDFGFV